MEITTVSSREVNQDIGRAKRAAAQGPVVITDRGRPAHVLLTWDAYQALVGGPRDLTAALAMPGLSEIEFDPAPASITLRPAELG